MSLKAASAAVLLALTVAAASPVETDAAPAVPVEAAAGAGGCGATWPAYPHVQTPMRGSCVVLGSPGLVKHFGWSTGSGGKASLQIRGFDANGKPFWHDCGAFGGVCKVPWATSRPTSRCGRSRSRPPPP